MLAACTGWDCTALDRWIPDRSESAAVRARVFGFPHAAGNTLFYRAWRKHFPPDIDFCPVELPGHGQRVDEAPFENLDALVANLHAVLQPLLAVPFAFFGHSTGACVALAAAQMLRAADGHRAVHLFVSARPGPGAVAERSIESFSDQDLLALLDRYGGTPAAVLGRMELVQAVLASLRADLALAHSHHFAAGVPVSCPITVFGGADDTIEIALLQSWRNFTTAAFRVRMFPGGHFYFADASGLLADEIGNELRRAVASLAPQLDGAAT
jgi:medium-chain acyl-[acyl-carrier-protein] hydrolase